MSNAQLRFVKIQFENFDFFFCKISELFFDEFCSKSFSRYKVSSEPTFSFNFFRYFQHNLHFWNLFLKCNGGCHVINCQPYCLSLGAQRLSNILAKQ
jgi:hypothetical protein